ncbi:hypothetical protein CSKR_114181 [Clonorchis sinensis]|uniref:Transmembrane protein n=1 Tax=Clonorchis sinensis TaxID=79923 RepID=A0A8T1MD32_CLOSI|nr:hypothetical protein CSKR_114181 [Clonorchis sinensis]
MADDPVNPVQIGGPPSAKRPLVVSCSPGQILLIVHLVIAIIVGIIGAAENRLNSVLGNRQHRDVALAFTIIGCVSSLSAIALVLVVLFLRVSKRHVLGIVLLSLVLFSLICFAISTGVSYIEVEMYSGAWLLSAAWVSVLGSVMAIFVYLSERDK